MTYGRVRADEVLGSQLNLITNSSDRLRITSAGLVGIGTTSPDQKFVVSGSGETNAKLSGAASTIGGYLYLQNTNTTDNNSMVIEGSDAQGNGTSQIQFINVSHTNNEGEIAFNTRPSGGSMAERIRIDSSGNIGIGLTNPSVKLHADGDGIEVRASNNANSKNISLYGGTSANDPAVTFTNALRFYSNSGSAERMRIDASGNVGIGDSAPNGNYGTNLSVHSTATNGARLKISDGTTGKGNTDGLDIISTGGIAYIIQRENAAMVLSTNATERMRITSGGLVNITGGVQVTENITPTSGSGVEIFKPSSTSGQISAYNRGSSAWMDLIFKGNTQQFHTNGSLAATIDSGGLLMLGTTTPGYSGYGDNLTIHDSGYCGMTIRSGNSSDTDIYFADSTTGAGRYAGNIRYSHANDRLEFATAGVHRLYIRSDGTIATTSAAAPLSVAAGSIVNSNANAGFFNNGYDGKFGTASNHPVYFQVNGVTKLTLNTSGNFGVGTTSPNQKVEVRGTGETNMLLAGTASTVGGYLYLQNLNGSDGNSMVIEGVDAQGQGVSQIQFYNVSHNNNEGAINFNTRASGGSMTQAVKITHQGNTQFAGQQHEYTNTSGTIISAISPGVSYRNLDLRANIITLATGAGSATTALTVANNQNIGIGTTSPGQKLTVQGSAGFASGSFLIESSSNAYTAGYFKGDSTGAFDGSNDKYSLNPTNGNAVFQGSVTASNVSDIKFKKNIDDARPQLDDVIRLGGILKNWDWKDDAPLNDEIKSLRFLGLIAQEAEEISPGLIYTVDTSYEAPRDSEDAEPEIIERSYKAINHDILVMKLLGAVKEAVDRIETLETEVQSLKSNTIE